MLVLAYYDYSCSKTDGQSCAPTRVFDHARSFVAAPDAFRFSLHVLNPHRCASRSVLKASLHSSDFSSPWPIMTRRNNNNLRKGSMNVVICFATGLLLAVCCFFYFSILFSPKFVRSILQDVMQCEGFEYLSSGTTASHSQIIPPKPSTVSAGVTPASLLTTLSGEDSRSITFDNDERVHLDHKSVANFVPPSVEKFRVLVGILTMASKTDRRNLLRLAYRVQSSDDADVTVRFVMGAFASDDDRTLVVFENATYGDIIVLGCPENLNSGKTFTFFSSLPEMGVSYDYVMKTDDDSYVRIENLGKHLKPLPRTDLYYGYILPCENDDAYSWYMAGMGYLISWDLVLWIKDSPIPRNHSIGTEDRLVGNWFNEGGKAKNRVNDKPLFYDHPEFGGKCAHELIPESILIHQVKTSSRWAQVLAFFEKDKISRALAYVPAANDSSS